ncbi:hypothetical protein SNOG_15616 [Parastagonospora nodorum SN15]|uniref:Uncharacterized protein n=1 Tax=Phaeosphaeria nodorum (strain SN15 / ATCC MYA-4574 / FGSC 10173) TaxID=321614 RepID=Q0TXY5_PHANO|nr:hypothetical protein SNOG_15616 [Parastagonospora nodorum SN15]EAT76991.2 hypothetical protein SNOG_15616 [Parastagonospora nodorum SN15]
MFVPRALRLKGVRETKPKPSKPPPEVTQRRQDEALVDAMQGISTNSPTPQEEQIEPKATPRGGPKFTVKAVTPEYLSQLVVGMELIFSDYAHQEEALREHPSKILELSSNGYHIRRIPSSYPPKFLPHNSFEQVNDDGLSFWDQRTIYVEPHLRDLCKTPARVAHWLREHGQLKQKWLPIQAVYTLHNSCAFIVLSGNITHADVWSKWRAAEKPDNWKILTKVEHSKRTAEYVALLEKQNPRSKGKHQLDDPVLPAIAKPAVLALNVEVVPAYSENIERPKNKRKRNRKKGDKTDAQVGEVETNNTTVAADEAQNDEPRPKRRA